MLRAEEQDDVSGYGCEPEDLQRLRMMLSVLNSPYQLTYQQRADVSQGLEIVISRIQACPLAQDGSLASVDSHTNACPRLKH